MLGNYADILCLLLNKPEDELHMAKAVASYKQEWMVERVFERLKD